MAPFAWASQAADRFDPSVLMDRLVYLLPTPVRGWAGEAVLITASGVALILTLSALVQASRILFPRRKAFLKSYEEDITQREGVREILDLLENGAISAEQAIALSDSIAKLLSPTWSAFAMSERKSLRHIPIYPAFLLPDVEADVTAAIEQGVVALSRSKNKADRRIVAALARKDIDTAVLTGQRQLSHWDDLRTSRERLTAALSIRFTKTISFNVVRRLAETTKEAWLLVGLTKLALEGAATGGQYVLDDAKACLDRAADASNMSAVQSCLDMIYERSLSLPDGKTERNVAEIERRAEGMPTRNRMLLAAIAQVSQQGQKKGKDLGAFSKAQSYIDRGELLPHDKSNAPGEPGALSFYRLPIGIALAVIEHDAGRIDSAKEIATEMIKYSDQTWKTEHLTELRDKGRIRPEEQDKRAKRRES